MINNQSSRVERTSCSIEPSVHSLLPTITITFSFTFCETLTFSVYPEMWNRANVLNSNALSESEIVDLIAAMNVNMSHSQLRTMFKKFDSDGNGALDFAEFQQFLDKLN